MIARAGAAVPFAPAGRLLGDLAGIALNSETGPGPPAEADGQPRPRVIQARAAAISARPVIPLPPRPPRTSSTSRSTAPACR